MNNSVYVAHRVAWDPYFALAVYQDLFSHGYDTFIDLNNYGYGSSHKPSVDPVCLHQIAARAYFLLVLTPGSLKACAQPDDKLRGEIENAIILNRKLIVVVAPTFQFDGEAEEAIEFLAILKGLERVQLPFDQFFMAMDQLRSNLSPIEISLTPPPDADFGALQLKIEQVHSAPQITSEKLEAQYHFEKAFYRSDEDIEGRMLNYNEALHLDPNYYTAYLNRALLRQIKDDYNGAIADFAQAIRLMPNNATTYKFRAFTRLKKGDPLGVIRDCSKAIDLDPNIAEIYMLRASAYTSLMDNYAALADYTIAIHLRPTYAAAYSLRGTLREKNNDFQGAVADYSLAIEHRIKNVHHSYVQRANAKRSLLDFKGAIDDLTEAIRIKPDLAEAYYFRGLAQQKLAQKTEAINDFTACIQLRPDHAPSYLMRGVLRHQNRDRRGALVDYERVLDLLPDNLDSKETHDLVIRLGRAADNPMVILMTDVLARVQQFLENGNY